MKARLDSLKPGDHFRSSGFPGLWIKHDNGMEWVPIRRDGKAFRGESMPGDAEVDLVERQASYRDPEDDAREAHDMHEEMFPKPPREDV